MVVPRRQRRHVFLQHHGRQRRLLQRHAELHAHGGPAPSVTSTPSTTFTPGNAGSFTVTTTGYPTAARAESGKLPGGVAFVDNHNGTATLSGMPAASAAGTSATLIEGSLVLRQVQPPGQRKQQWG